MRGETGTQWRFPARWLATVAVVLQATGCASWLGLETLPLEGDAFSTSLAEEYKAFAEVQVQHYDWWDARHFARKARKAAEGKEVPPEFPSLYEMPEEKRHELGVARQRLLEMLNPTVKSRFPEEAARVQALYDCWLEQQGDKAPEEAVISCRERYYAMLDELDTELLTKHGITAHLQETPFVVYFASGSAWLDAEAIRVIVEAANAASEHDGNVILVGHTDSVGTAVLNQRLSKRRVHHVQQSLSAIGVDEARLISVFRGEAEASEATGGRHRKSERRVEIFVEPGGNSGSLQRTIQGETTQ